MADKMRSPIEQPPSIGKPLVERLKTYFDNFNHADLDLLDEFYSDSVVFKDPVHELRGIGALHTYLTDLNDNLTQCRFEYLDQIVTENTAYLKWNMHFRHASLGDKPISVRGVSQLRFDHSIYYQEDFYDLGSMVYEHVPLIGRMTRWLKSRLSS